METVSVLMCTYKEPVDFVRKAFESMASQTYNISEFVVVVDDPENKEVIEYLTDYQQKDPRVQISINETNMGLVKSLNKGIKLCHGTYIARMDADDISSPERIGKQLDFMAENGYDMVSCWLNVFTDTPDNGTISIFPTSHEKIVEFLNYDDCLPHPGWLLKKEIYEACDGYRNIKACEDYDFVVRAVRKGYKVGNVGEALLNYRNNPKSISSVFNSQQLLTSRMIASYYAAGKELPIEDYDAYINSEKFKKELAEEQRFRDIKQSFVNAKGIDKLFKGIGAVLNIRFLNKYLKTKKYSKELKRLRTAID